MPAADDEIFKVRDRLHRIADMAQQHEGSIIAHGIKIEMLEKQVTYLSTQAATREQLDGAVIAGWLQRIRHAGTLTFDGVNATRFFGGVIASSITITEIQP